ncbi:MAG TPA: hypothetical protein VK466_11675, partial [Terriglobales bacterium]|nr:hypothetical protein [Terriglobales bacterium]
MKKRDDEFSQKESSSRRGFLQAGVMGGVAAALYPALGAARAATLAGPAPQVKPFEFEEITIDELQASMRSGKYTSQSITQMYLERIQDVDKG